MKNLRRLKTVTTAKKLLFDYKVTLFIVPNNTNINSARNTPYDLSYEDMNKTMDSFEQKINAFKYYNCNKDMGYGVSYYIDINNPANKQLVDNLKITFKEC